jgi:hypothetical protein
MEENIMPGYEILCANKSPDGLLIRIGGDGWSFSLHEAVVKLASSEIRLFVMQDGVEVEVGMRGEGTDTYLALEPDGFPVHELAEMPSC